MAAYTDQPPRSRRFIKVYLATWALLAVGALAYLGLLAFQPYQGAARQRTADSDSSQVMRALTKTAAEMSAMRRGLTVVQQDVAVLKEAAAEREVKDLAVTTRLTAVEEKLATLSATAEPPDALSGKARVSDRHQRKSPEPKIIARAVTQHDRSEAAASRHDGPPVPLETGSILRKAEITFGEPVVRKAGPIAFAVQLAAGPSLPGLRQSWGQLRERHGALAALEPRVVAPRNEGGPYRLLAGPFATRADADRVCTEMGVGRNGCYVTTYIGTPL